MSCCRVACPPGLMQWRTKPKTKIISGEGVWGFVLAPVGSNGGVVWHELVVEPTMHNAVTRAV